MSSPELAGGENAGIDTTPTLPRPPARLIELAVREIPGALANVQPRHDGAVELIASHLARRLQEAQHTLAAAQWAIHEAIQAGRLRAGLVEAEMPSFLPRGSKVWQGGGRRTIAIPKGKPAPFDAFKVTATESLWTWWRSIDAGDSQKDERPAEKKFVENPMADTERPSPFAMPEPTFRFDQEKKATCHSPTEEAQNKLTLIRDFNRGLQKAQADALKDKNEGRPTVGPTAPTRKRSTEQGESRAKLIAALTKHHQYADGSCLNLEPIGNNELARLAEVDKATASGFFKKQFGGHSKYRKICADPPRLIAALKLLNGEFAPHHLYGAKPPDKAAPEEE